MADNQSYRPGRDNLELARRLDPGRKDSDRQESDDPLLPVLHAYKSQAELKVRTVAGPALWQSVDKQTAPGSAGLLRLRPALWRAAAVLLAAVSVAVFFLVYPAEQPRQIAASGSERLELTLADGSSVTLRPNSRLYEIRESETEQRYLIRGEAWFEVPHVPGREFSVETVDALVTVLGTSFSMSDWGDRTRVYLESGSVSFSVRDGTGPVLLEPGQFSEYRDEFLTPPQPSGEDVFTGWLRNQLILNHRPLHELADEMSHHFGIRIIIPDEYREEQLGGTLPLDAPQNILDDIATSLGGRFEQSSPGTWRFVPDGG